MIGPPTRGTWTVRRRRSVSLAGLLITTEAMIPDKPEPKGQAGGGMPGGMDGMM